MKSLYLLDGMALAYRAHFALIRSPIYTSKGFNTSAIFGFTGTLIELITQAKADPPRGRLRHLRAHRAPPHSP